MIEALGKLPPQAIDAEEAVLGAILLMRGAIDDVVNELPEEAFYKDSHQMIYAACKALHNRNEPIDLRTVDHELKKTGELDKIGGIMTIVNLTNKVASSANIKFHARIIAQCFAKREIIRISGQSMKSAFEDSSDPFELFETIDKEIQSCKEKILGGIEQKEWSEQLNETVEIIETLSKAELKVSGIPTGNAKLDSITGGWQKTDLIIIAARPSQGKTSKSLNLIKTACLYGYKPVMFSLEMSYRQVARKFLNEESEIYGNKLITGDINSYQLIKLKDAKEKLINFNFHLNDKGGINTNYIRNVLKIRKKKIGVDLVVIDYLGLMKPVENIRGRSRDNEIGTITSSLKNIAKEFDVPVILMSQLNRKCEERIDKRPILSDLRESGNVEQDADIVMGIYRPSYYYSWDKDKDYSDEISNGMNEEQYKRIAELHILKNRNGQVDKYIKENFYGEFSRFVSQDAPQPQLQPTLNISNYPNGNPDKFIESATSKGDPF